MLKKEKKNPQREAGLGGHVYPIVIKIMVENARKNPAANPSI